MTGKSSETAVILALYNGTTGNKLMAIGNHRCFKAFARLKSPFAPHY